MGLAERQKWAQMKENDIKTNVATLREILGAPIECSFDEASFPNVDAIDSVRPMFFGRFIDEVSYLCKDDLVKQAVVDGIKTINVRYQDSGSPVLVLKDGVMTVTAKWNGNGDEYVALGNFSSFLMSNLN